MEKSILYYHNPRCSKSRQGLNFLKSKNIIPEIKEYLKEGIAQNEFLELLSALELLPLQGVIRVKESLFTELGLKGKMLTDNQWAKIISENPSLIERPILKVGNKAVIGRPAEKFLEII